MEFGGLLCTCSNFLGGEEWVHILHDMTFTFIDGLKNTVGMYRMFSI
jgi:hypothetical protein